MQSFDPYDPAYLSDPLPHYKWLRDEHPVYHCEERELWIVTRHEDVYAALRDHETFSSRLGNSPEPGWAPGMIGTDRPDHARLRGIVRGVLTPKNVTTNWEPRIVDICSSLVDAALDQDSFDAFQSLSLALPITVITELMGIPDGDMRTFKQWSDWLVEAARDLTDRQAMTNAITSLKEQNEYFLEVTADRRKAPRDDLITRIVQAGEEERLSEKECIEFCILLLLAGNETTTNLIGNGLMALTAFPDQQQLLRDKPELMGQAVEEMLRFCPPTQSISRTTNRELELHGKTIPKGARVVFYLASANRDERRFERPDVFDIENATRDHLSFGSGIHFCFGASLARMEATRLFEVILSRTSDIQVVAEPTMYSSPVVRGPVAQPMRFVPAPGRRSESSAGNSVRNSQEAT